MHRSIPTLVLCTAAAFLVVACDADPESAQRADDTGPRVAMAEPSHQDLSDEPVEDAVAATVAAFRAREASIGPREDAVRQPTRTPIPPTVTPVPPTATETPPPTPTVPPTPTPDPLAQAGRPTRLEIPALAVDAFVEEVGLTTDRAMDVPKEWMNVGWYNRGFRPGESGNAVIAGHLDTTSGGPAVFWDLGALAPGDEVHVTYESGDRYTFIVQETGEFDHNAQGEIIDLIFGESPTPDLNLITCQGTWDRTEATYDKRLVVFTTLAPERTVRAEPMRSNVLD